MAGISFLLRFAFGEVEGGDGLRLLLGDADGAEGLFVAHDVFLQGTEEALGMLGGEDDATPDLGLGDAWKDTGEVDDEIATGMGDNGEVGVLALGYLLGQLELQTLLLIVLFFHIIID